MRDWVDLGVNRLLTGGERLKVQLWPDHPLLADETSPSVREGSRVLFVCLGNINRSPFAERYARQRLDDGGIDRQRLGGGISVESTGLIREEGRSSPDRALTVAEEFGVDLSDHRSSTVTQAALDDADLVFLMDVDNYRDLRRRRRVDLGKTYLLGSIPGPTDGVEVADPHGGSVREYRQAFSRIADAVDRLLADAGEEDQEPR